MILNKERIFNIKEEGMAAILMGFNYDGDQELPGMLIDLYSMYRISRLNFETIYVITDIEEDPHVGDLSKLIINDTLDVDVGFFISDLKKNGRYISFSRNKNHGESIENVYDLKSEDRSLNMRRMELEIFRKILSEIGDTISDIPSLFIYFGGHGSSNGEVYLPNQLTFSLKEIRNLIIKKLNPEAEVFFVTDCCYGTNLDMPYQLQGNKFKLTLKNIHLEKINSGKINLEKINSEKIKLETIKLEKIKLETTKLTDIYPEYTPLQKIIYIVSSRHNEKAVSTWKGSPFTYELAHLIRKQISDLPTLKKMLSEKVSVPTLVTFDRSAKILQSIEIYSSYPNIMSIWRWMYGIRNIKVFLNRNFLTLTLNHKLIPPKRIDDIKTIQNKIDYQINKDLNKDLNEDQNEDQNEDLNQINHKINQEKILEEDLLESDLKNENLIPMEFNFINIDHEKNREEGGNKIIETIYLTRPKIKSKIKPINFSRRKLIIR